MSEPSVSGDPLEQQRLVRTGAWCRVARDVVRVEGADATTFLQGQLSQDLTGVAVGESVWSLLLQPNGKVDAWLRATRLGEASWLCDVDAGWGQRVVDRLTRFLLRTKATVTLDDGWVLRAVRGPAEVALTHPSEVEVLALPVWWPGLVGYDLLAPAGVPVGLDLPEVGAEALDAVRIECGVPAMGAELTDASIPAEAGQWLIDASVSFTKGCYTGQELVARIDSRGGNVPHPVRGLAVAGPDVPTAGAAVLVDDVSVGRVTSAARSAALGGPAALAVVGRAVVPGTTVTVAWDGAQVPAEVRSLPMVGG